jgi:hypothetical protein
MLNENTFGLKFGVVFLAIFGFSRQIYIFPKIGNTYCKVNGTPNWANGYWCWRQFGCTHGDDLQNDTNHSNHNDRLKN